MGSTCVFLSLFVQSMGVRVPVSRVKKRFYDTIFKKSVMWYLINIKGTRKVWFFTQRIRLSICALSKRNYMFKTCELVHRKGCLIQSRKYSCRIKLVKKLKVFLVWSSWWQSSLEDCCRRFKDGLNGYVITGN